MAGFLTDEWIEELDLAAAGATLPEGLRLVVQQVVTDGAAGEVAYVLEAADGRLHVHAGRTDAADVTFTQDRATAAAIARGELSAQRAFLDGRLALQGDLQGALTDLGALAAIDDVFAPTRASTTW